jgi:DNA-binding NarL/FixJ family response regulator
MIRVLIVAAYASVRAGLHSLLADAPDCEMVGEVAGSTEFEALLPAACPDVVVLDYQDSEGDGSRVLDLLPGSGEIGLVLMAEHPHDYQLLLDRPLRGWASITREADAQEIAGAVRAVAAGLVAFDRNLIALLLEGITPDSTSEYSRESDRAHVDVPDQAVPNRDALTSREREVLQLMAQGLPNKTIARRLSISQHTVKFHVASILAKLGAASRTEAVTVGARRGYVLL